MQLELLGMKHFRGRESLIREKKTNFSKSFLHVPNKRQNLPHCIFHVQSFEWLHTPPDRPSSQSELHNPNSLVVYERWHRGRLCGKQREGREVMRRENLKWCKAKRLSDLPCATHSCFLSIRCVLVLTRKMIQRWTSFKPLLVLQKELVKSATPHSVGLNSTFCFPKDGRVTTVLDLRLSGNAENSKWRVILAI